LKLLHRMRDRQRRRREVLQKLRAQTVTKPPRRSPQRTRRTQRFLGLALSVLCVLCGGNILRAQFQMPDPKQMSGIPRPVGDLPDGSITVLVVRGSVTNGLPGQTVELRVGS